MFGDMYKCKMSIHVMDVLCSLYLEHIKIYQSYIKIIYVYFEYIQVVF